MSLLRREGEVAAGDRRPEMVASAYEGVMCRKAVQMQGEWDLRELGVVRIGDLQGGRR